MIWGNPAALWLLTLAVPLTGLFIYRRKARLVIVPSLMYWVARTGFASGSPFGQRLRRPLTLLAQILILFLLVFGLADPQAVKEHPDEMFIVIDCSATMQTHEQGHTRLGQAVTRAREIAEGLVGPTRLTLIRAGGLPEVVFRGKADDPQIGNALGALEPADMDSDLPDALLMVGQFVRPDRTCHVVIISDFCRADVESIRADMPNVELHQVGSPQLNRGIVHMDFDHDRKTLIVTVGDNQPEGHAFQIDVVTDEGVIAHQAGVTREELTQVTLPLKAESGQSLRVVLEPPDTLPLDNVAYGVVPAMSRVSVRLVNPGNAFLEQAIKASDAVELDTVSSRLWTHDNWPDVTILDGPLLDEPMALSGHFIVFSPQAADAIFTDEAALTWWLPSHPVLSGAEPISWGYVKGVGGKCLPAARTIVASDAGPLLYEWPDPQATLRGNAQNPPPHSRTLVFNFELEDSELIHTSAFPVLLWNSIGYLTGHEMLETPIASPTGTAIVDAMRSVPTPPLATDPHGASFDMIRVGEQFVWTSTEKQGIYTYGDEQHRRHIAMNWMSLATAVPFAPVTATPESAETDTALLVLWARHASWRQLLVVGLIVCMIEWILFQRRYLRMD